MSMFNTNHPTIGTSDKQVALIAVENKIHIIASVKGGNDINHYILDPFAGTSKLAHTIKIGKPFGGGSLVSYEGKLILIFQDHSDTLGERAFQWTTYENDSWSTPTNVHDFISYFPPRAVMVGEIVYIASIKYRDSNFHVQLYAADLITEQGSTLKQIYSTSAFLYFAPAISRYEEKNEQGIVEEKLLVMGGQIQGTYNNKAYLYSQSYDPITQAFTKPHFIPNYFTSRDIDLIRYGNDSLHCYAKAYEDTQHEVIEHDFSKGAQGKWSWGAALHTLQGPSTIEGPRAMLFFEHLFVFYIETNTYQIKYNIFPMKTTR